MDMGTSVQAFTRPSCAQRRSLWISSIISTCDRFRPLSQRVPGHNVPQLLDSGSRVTQVSDFGLTFAVVHAGWSRSGYAPEAPPPAGHKTVTSL